MTRFLMCCLAVFLACAAGPGAGAAEEPELTPIPLASGEWLPYVSARLPDHGILGGLVERVLARMGARPVWTFVSWPMVEQMVQSGKAFAGLPYVRTAERAGRYDYSLPLYAANTTVFFHASSPLAHNKLKSIADLRGYSAAGPRGYWWDSVLADHGVKLIYSTDEAAAFKVLAAGRVDFLLQDELVGLEILTRNLGSASQGIRYIPLPSQGNAISENLHLIVSRQYPQSDQLRARFDEALTEELKSGELDRAIERYRASLPR